MRQTTNNLTVFLLLLTLTATILIVISCDDSPTGPEEPEPGKREYAWTAETLYTSGSGVILDQLWGSSDSDVWAAGAGNFNNQLWHYNGTSWTTDSAYRAFLGAGQLFGFSQDNVWLSSGSSGGIWHFNGIFWTKSYSPDYPGYNHVVYNGIWGRNENDIYASGFAKNSFTEASFGVVIHYDGNKWSKVDITKVDNMSYNHLVYDRNAQVYIVSGIQFINNILYGKLLTFDGKIFKEFYSEIGTIPYLSIIKNELYIVIRSHRTIYTYSNGKLKEFIKFDETMPFRRFMIGRSRNDFFTSNYNGLGHYNGTDLQTIYITDNQINAIWVRNKSVFAILRTANVDFIMLKGTLIENEGG